MRAKRYTLTVSNEIAEKRHDGRDSSTILYEYSFDTQTGPMKKYVEWKEFMPMYRGRLKDDAVKLDIGNIRRWSFMIRSFFAQHGEFSMSIRCVCAYQGTKSEEQIEEVISNEENDVDVKVKVMQEHLKRDRTLQ